MKEVLLRYQGKIESSDILRQLGLSKGDFFLVSSHREENVDNDKSFILFHEILNNLASDFNIPVIVSTHPRTRKRLEMFNTNFNELIRFLSPLAFTDYIKLQNNARVTLSDSGTITEESSILNFPALNIRETNERPEGMEEGAVMMVGMSRSRIYEGIKILEIQGHSKDRKISIVDDYDVNNVSEKVLRIIQSYTDYINRVVWKKY